jgi:ketol-acid reductoisomerase
VIRISRLKREADIIKVLLPTDEQENFFKRSIEIYIETAAACFGVITVIRERTI